MKTRLAAWALATALIGVVLGGSLRWTAAFLAPSGGGLYGSAANNGVIVSGGMIYVSYQDQCPPFGRGWTFTDRTWPLTARQWPKVLQLGMGEVMVVLPLWVPLLVSGVATALAARRQRGGCAACGYDLTGLDRCPECGRETNCQLLPLPALQP